MTEKIGFCYLTRLFREADSWSSRIRKLGDFRGLIRSVIYVRKTGYPGKWTPVPHDADSRSAETIRRWCIRRVARPISGESSDPMAGSSRSHRTENP